MSVKLVAMEGHWLVFNRAAMRREVVEYMWGRGFVPTPTELYSQTEDIRILRGQTIELPHTHWALARTTFAARPDLHQRIRPEIRQLMATLPRRRAVWTHTPQRTRRWYQ